jgi:hypothetical protein
MQDQLLTTRKLIDKTSTMISKNKTLIRTELAMKLFFHGEDIEKHLSLLDRHIDKIYKLRMELLA